MDTSYSNDWTVPDCFKLITHPHGSNTDTIPFLDGNGDISMVGEHVFCCWLLVAVSLPVAGSDFWYSTTGADV